MYYDGANANALMGNTRPGDMGFDLMHLNLHKTFSIPHGGGGAGAGPIGVAEAFVKYLPTPVSVRDEDGTYRLDFDRPSSIGQMRSFWSNFAHVVRALTYVYANGAEGLKKISELAVLNANYVRVHVKEFLETPYDEPCRHGSRMPTRRSASPTIRNTACQPPSSVAMSHARSTSRRRCSTAATTRRRSISRCSSPSA